MSGCGKSKQFFRNGCVIVTVPQPLTQPLTQPFASPNALQAAFLGGVAMSIWVD